LVRGNEFSSQRFSGNFDTEFGSGTTLNVSGRYSETEREGFPDDSGGYVFGVGLTHRAGNATFALALGYFDRDDHIDSPGIAPGVRDPFGVPPSIVDT